MKIHKYTIYYFDMEEFGPNEFPTLIHNSDFLTSIFYNGEAEIGEWGDGHELNKANVTQLTFDKYFQA